MEDPLNLYDTAKRLCEGANSLKMQADGIRGLSTMLSHLQEHRDNGIKRIALTNEQDFWPAHFKTLKMEKIADLLIEIITDEISIRYREFQKTKDGI